MGGGRRAAGGGRAVDPATFDVYQLERGRLSLALGDAARAEHAVSAIAVGEGGRHPPLDRLAAQLVLAHASALDARWDDALAYAGAVVTTVDSYRFRSSRWRGAETADQRRRTAMRGFLAERLRA